MEPKILGVQIVLSIIIVISGAYLVSYVEIETEMLGQVPIFTATKPFALPGYILLFIGLANLFISVALLIGIVLIREAKVPPS